MATLCGEASPGGQGRIVPRHSGTENKARLPAEAKAQSDVDRRTGAMTAALREEPGA